MDTSHDADRRLNELEIKASFTEDLLDQLNLTIYRQQQQIQRTGDLNRFWIWWA